LLILSIECGLVVRHTSGLAVAGDPHGVAAAFLGSVDGRNGVIVVSSSSSETTSLVENIMGVMARSSRTQGECCGHREETSLHIREFVTVDNIVLLIFLSFGV
jgi:hypothetical protein